MSMPLVSRFVGVLTAITLLSGCTSSPSSSSSGSVSHDATALASTAMTSSAVQSAPGETLLPAPTPGTIGPTTNTSGTAPAMGLGSSDPMGQTVPPASSTTSTSPPTIPAVSTSGPAVPTGGNVNQTVATVPVTTSPAVSVGETADFGGKIEAQVVKTAAITGVSQLPGEIGGPSVAVTVQITNGSTAAIGLNSVIVALTDSAGAPAPPLSSSPASPLHGVLRPGATVSGVYVFTLAANLRTDVQIAVSYSTGAPVLQFKGAVAGG